VPRARLSSPRPPDGGTGTSLTGVSDRLEPGDLAPDFTLPATHGGSWQLSEHRGRSVVVYFYPAAGTPGCTTQACDFRDNLASLTAAGFDVVGISPDPLPELESWVAEEQLPFPLASDTERGVIERYGAWGEKTMYGRTTTGLLRSTVVVDPEGVVRSASYNVKATGHVARLRKELGVD